MERRPKPATSPASRRIDQQAVNENAAVDLASLPHIADLIDYGQITIGVMQPVGCIAAATEGRNCLAMLRRREGETLVQLLTRLDLAIAKAMLDDVFTDEINTPR